MICQKPSLLILHGNQIFFSIKIYALYVHNNSNNSIAFKKVFTALHLTLSICKRIGKY
jgi:hypothetical protein